jgi:hypothetical protein
MKKINKIKLQYKNWDDFNNLFEIYSSLIAMLFFLEFDIVIFIYIEELYSSINFEINPIERFLFRDLTKTMKIPEII